MTDQQVVDTMRDLAAQNVKQAFVHPRPGLMTPYLSDEWFRLFKVALREAEKLDVNVWIYDENSYPSGFAGGFVPDAMPESRGRGLGFRETNAAPKWADDTIAVFRLKEKTYEIVSDKIRSGAVLPEDRYLVASLLRAQPSPWYGGKTYVDLMYPGVTEKFLAVTLDAYRREVGDQFGKRIPGVFTDEPELRPAGGFPWTDSLPQIFEQRWGYRLTDHLPALREPLGDWKRIRHNYYQVLLEQFIERWAKPYYEYCERNRIEFTGHYWEHEWPNCISVPDNMAMSAWQQRPGIDILMNQYQEGTHAQFGNVRSVKELASVANQLGRSRTLCEAYGAGGWDLRFEDMKRIGDWMYALGVNTLDEHLSYVTIRGARKRDHPQSFSYHEPWWEAYHTNASYFSRLTVALSSGRQLNDILVLEPTTSAWMLNSGARNQPDLDRLGDAFQKLVLALETAQVEFDLGCEDILARHGSIAGSALRAGQRDYRTVILPPFTESLNAKTVDLLEQYARSGGVLLACGPPPERIDGSLSDRGKALAQAAGWRQVEAEALPSLLLKEKKDSFVIRRADGDRGILFHHRRRLDDGDLVFLANTSIEARSSGALESGMRGVELWNLETGKVEAYPFEAAGSGVRAAFDLPPSGSLLLFLSREPRKAAPPRTEKRARIGAEGKPEIHPVAPNVLVLDYLDVSSGGKTLTDTYFYEASRFVFKNSGLDRNPWDSSVQFRDELVTKKFPPSSGLEARYRFTIEGPVPPSLSIVIERPDLYSVTCNGKIVAAAKGAWWLDKAFGKIDIAAAARQGENVVELKASPLTIYHELESAYVLGDFALRVTDKGFVIGPQRPLDLGAWNGQGYPFYSAGVSYTERFRLPAPSGRYLVSLGRWYGSVAKLIVNGKPAGFIGAPPWERDVTSWLRQGDNTIAVVVIGTLKNTLGPHHGNPALGTAWPAMFQKAPSPGPPAGGQYSLVGYGLMEPFALVQIAR